MCSSDLWVSITGDYRDYRKVCKRCKHIHKGKVEQKGNIVKKILITGVGGNVGRYIGDDLADAGYEVVGVYRNKIPMGSNYILIQADLSKHFSGGGRYY